MEHPWTTALVTGASSGIGEAVARQLVAAGVAVALVARRADRLDSLAAELRAGGAASVEVLVADLTVDADLATVVDRLADPARPIDLLVNCAGLGAAGPFADSEPATSQHIIDLNVSALVALTHAAVLPMTQRDRGWILNVSSLGGHTPGPSFAVYSASKAFVTSFSESLHEELRGTGVHVTVACPGATHTEFGATSGADGGDLPAFLWQTADAVARESLAAAAAGKAVRVTGLLNRVTAAITTVLPRSANRRLAGLVTDQL